MREWSPRAGLNRRPHPYQGCALPLSYKGKLGKLSSRPSATLRVEKRKMGKVVSGYSAVNTYLKKIYAYFSGMNRPKLAAKQAFRPVGDQVYRRGEQNDRGSSR